VAAAQVLGDAVHQVRARHRLWALAHRWSGELLDLAHGVSTARTERLESFGLWAPMRGEYEPAGWARLRAALRAEHVGPDAVFLDAGSGKGRAVLVAAGFAFRRVIGVELVPALHERAADNLRRFRGRRRCAEIELVCGDATELPLPDDVTHIFLNNPFEQDLVDRFLDRVTESQQRRPRPIRLIYLHPTGAQRMLARGARPVAGGARGRRRMDLVVYDL
jgi:SAM-dependent methyltransferase